MELEMAAPWSLYQPLIGRKERLIKIDLKAVAMLY